MKQFGLSDMRPSAPQYLTIVVFIAVLARSTHQTLRDPDTYLHLAAGRWMLTHRQLPLTDPFSYPMNGAPWMIHEWLAQVILQLTFEMSSWSGLVVLTALIFSLTISYLYRFLLERIAPVYALVFCALAFFGLGTHLLVRPHLLTWPILAIWTGHLIQAAENKKTPSYWLLPLMVLWSNLHGGFILGIALLCPLAIEAVFIQKSPHARGWIRFTLLAIIASMMTPLGWKTWWMAVELMTLSTLSMIGEWASPTFSALNPIELWLILILTLGTTGQLRLNPIRIILVLALLHQALAHGRYISIFCLLVPMLIASGLTATTSHPRNFTKENWLDHLFSKTKYTARLPAALLTIATLFSITIYFGTYKVYAPPSVNTPKEALESVQKEGIEGNVLNFYNFGAYLLYREVPVFIDGRADLYGDEHIKNYLKATDSSNPKKINAFLEHHNIHWTIFPPKESINQILSTQRDWKRFYQDDVAIVYVREKQNCHESM